MKTIILPVIVLVTPTLQAYDQNANSFSAFSISTLIVSIFHDYLGILQSLFNRPGNIFSHTLGIDVKKGAEDEAALKDS